MRVESGIEEMLTYMRFPREHWVRIRTNNTVERLNREFKRGTRVVGSLPITFLRTLHNGAPVELGTKRGLFWNRDLNAID